MLPEYGEFNDYEYDRLILAERSALSIDNIDIWKPIERPPCGTTKGYYFHRSREEPVCDECKEANNVARRVRAQKNGRPLKARQFAPCGSRAAYRRHIRNKEPIDILCALGNNRVGRDEYHRKKKT